MAKSLGITIQQAKVIKEMTESKGLGDKVFEVEEEDEELRMNPEIAIAAF